ncbi:bifunctional 4-hydroxy-2-oxoglutarate aldolase/2-dehydro-3-deoxy-phosphogluconate aldolase [Natronomonas sp. F2-12]|uniref:Bifunctional 4-hydroxy-2-oxoglutarate aldolase/2-dehydro-3-deoxy-phosphogluconate aldolase n=1 Tax=Natronomonas aquatica TaxID=2841590 RepID=A0A9R1CNY8_9EURY|nr:bifunctional 4-hydroxy-2-oxoglutarate aldolase/2-dehydro-3-deoxy-phosphogluconate aldolase [Natronomonas aquatica]MCQ4332228.1 bifunctional 4-hydroxy-2-oxoglutarate aldolase/2-dehydro-3-deoxy-phosphogluconate aldolase [Natronomonas aquatica]
MNTRDALAPVLDTGVVAIARGVGADSILDVVDALVAGGIRACEVTADSPAALESIERIAAAFGEEVTVGAGTVLDAETARACQRAGAEFLVTPTVETDVIRTGNRHGTPTIPGVMTPTEALTATEAGADMCKLFPASTLGPSHVSAIGGPLGQIPLVPTGGVTPDNAAAFFESGAAAVGVGSALVDADAVANGEYDRLTETATRLIDIAETAR